MDFKDKVVLITGASSGLGAATAVYFSRLSAKVVLVGRNEKNLKAIALQCEKTKAIKPLSIIADVSKEADVERIVKETIDHFGKLDVLVNNAGITEMGGIKDKALEKYDKIMSVNVRGVLQLTTLAVPHLIKTKGSIVNISSIASTKAFPAMLAYCMSKAAVDHFTKCTALDLAADGVRVNSVNPGLVKTNILNGIGLSKTELDELTTESTESTPLKKLAEPYDIAAMVAFLASENAKSITGCIHNIDGGKLLI